MSTEYYNPHTGRWESREELGERPATAETVLASEDYFGPPLPAWMSYARLRAPWDALMMAGAAFDNDEPLTDAELAEFGFDDPPGG